MKRPRAKPVSLLWRILLSTSVALTAVFAITGWMVQRYATRVTRQNLEGEVRTSSQAYRALWTARARNLATVSRLIGSMPDVRAAFMTGDQATVRDTAERLWSEISEEDASFLVLKPTGEVIASLGGDYPRFGQLKTLLPAALKHFPTQVAGYLTAKHHLYYVVLTPVYVQAGAEQALLNVLLVAVDINEKLAYQLKSLTNGSDFAFVSGGVVLGSTQAGLRAQDLESGQALQRGTRLVRIQGTDSLLLRTILNGFEGQPAGELFVIRSFSGPKRALTRLQANMVLIWLAAIAAGIFLTYVVVHRILEPVQRLDRAAAEVIRQNYNYRVPVEREDELGRLARTFNAMCESIQSAREELIRQERINTIGRLSSSIVHDLRNPLAAIYGGAEMLVDTELSPSQTSRLAGNIYRASRRIQELLQELAEVSRASTRPTDLCSLAHIVAAAYETIARTAQIQSIRVQIEVPPELEIVADQSRLERVFVNLMNNALEAMPGGGSLSIKARQGASVVKVEIEDTGTGISKEAWPNLFQPFASFGKRNGLGLGLALSRQTLLDHGGDLWADEQAVAGARFVLRLPLANHAGAANHSSETVPDSSRPSAISA
jgi:signal transduction histidine kinase